MLRKSLLVPKGKAVRQQKGQGRVLLSRASRITHHSWARATSEVIPNFAKRCQIRLQAVHRRDCCQVAKNPEI